VIYEQEFHGNTEECSVSSPDQLPTEALNAIRPLCQMVIDINDCFPLICLVVLDICSSSTFATLLIIILDSYVILFHVAQALYICF
jgi:hypothetical protein